MSETTSGTLQGETFKVGDLVTTSQAHYSSVRPGDVFKVEKAPTGARQVNYIVKPVDPATGDLIPGARGLKGPAYVFTKYDPANPPAAVETVAFVPVPVAGTAVTVSGLPKINPDDLYIVMGYGSRDACAKLVKLHGDGGRYWPNVPVAALTVVEREQITFTKS